MYHKPEHKGMKKGTWYSISTKLEKKPTTLNLRERATKHPLSNREESLLTLNN